MARLANALLFLFLAAIAAAAIADAVRRDSEPAVHRRAAATALPRTQAAVEGLRAAGVRGTLYYADASCRIGAVRLPTLEPAAAPRLHACGFVVSPAGSEASSWSIWNRAEPLVASCRAGGVEIASPRGSVLALVGGCGPAWGPRGELTFIRRGDVVAFPLHGRARVVLARDWLRRALRLRRPVAAVSVAWAGRRGLAVVVRTRSADDIVALFAGSRLVAHSRPGGHLAGVTTRRDGRALIVEQPGRRGLVLLDAGLRVTDTRHARAAAWSPDGRRLAVAQGSRLLILDAGSRRLLAPPLRLEAVALSWR